MASPRLILVTGATGKVGQTFMRRLLGDPAHAGDRIRALCHDRLLPASERIEIVSGSIAERAVVERAVAGVTHVLHLATCKETPEDVVDVLAAGGPPAAPGIQAVHPDRRRCRHRPLLLRAATSARPMTRARCGIPASAVDGGGEIRRARTACRLRHRHRRG